MPPSCPTPQTEKQTSYRIFTKLAYLFSARWLRDACMAGFLIYLARTAAATYGEFMMALGLGSIVLFVAEFGLNLPLVGLVARQPGQTRAYLAQALALKTGLLLLAVTGAVVFVFWQGYSPELKLVVLVIGAGVGLEALATTFFVSYQVQGRQDQESKIRVAAALLGFGYGAAALALGAPPVVVALFKPLETLAIIIGGAVGLKFPGPAAWRWPQSRQLRDLAKLGLIFGVIEISASIYNKANLFFLQRYGGADGVAQYSATWQVVDGLAVLVSGLLLKNVLYPLFVQLWDSDRPAVLALTRHTARWLLLIAWGLMFGLTVGADLLIGLIYGANYAPAAELQKYLVATIFFAFFHNLAAYVMISMKKERLLLAFYLTGLAVNLLACGLLIPAAPLTGAAMAMVLTKGTVGCLTIAYVQRRLRFLPRAAVLPVLGAAGLGVAIYAVSLPWMPQEAAGVLGLLPGLGLAWHWWRTRPGAGG